MTVVVEVQQGASEDAERKLEGSRERKDTTVKVDQYAVNVSSGSVRT